MSLNFITKSLNTKLIALFMMLAVAPMAIISVISYNTSSDELGKSANYQLLTLAGDRNTALSSINSLRIEQLSTLGTEPVVVHGTKYLLTQDAFDIEDLNKKIPNFISTISDFGKSTGEDGYHNFRIISSEGAVLYSDNANEIGQDYSTNNVFVKSREHGFREYVQDDGKRIALTGVPIQDADGSKYGVLMAATGIKALDNIVLNREGLRETGETYLVSYDRILITPSRFTEGLEFKQKADTLPVKECFDNGRNIEAQIYPDYRGVPIFGASQCEKELGYVLIAEYDVAEIQAPVVALQNTYLTVGGIIAGAVGTFAFFMSRSISRPIKSAALVAQKISEGDLTVTVPETKFKDEIGTLITAEKQMVNSLRSILSKVQEASGTVSASSEQLSASGQEINSAVQQIATTIDQISKGSQSQAQRTEQSKQSAERLAKSMNALSESAKMSASATDNVMVLSEKGAESAKEAGHKMDKIIEVTGNSATKVKGLADKTNEIVSVLDVIRQIADQTNLLALNAAIEAARAGEAGRGFAVVADEVRRLAESSAKSADEISVKLVEMQEQAKQVVDEIEISSSEVSQGKHVIESALNSMSEIVTNIKDVSHNIKDLSETAQNQIAEVSSVSTGVAEIATISEENAAASEEAAAAVEEQTSQTQEISTSANHLAELASRLQSEISRFKLDGFASTASSGTISEDGKSESEMSQIKTLVAKIKK